MVMICDYQQILWHVCSLLLEHYLPMVKFFSMIKNVTEPANIHGCGFHVQNPSDLDADADYDTIQYDRRV